MSDHAVVACVLDDMIPVQAGICASFLGEAAGMTSLSFSAPSDGAGYFLFRQKVAKDHRACGGGLDNVLLSRLPLPLADRAPARTPASLQSDMRAFAARSASRLRHRQWRIHRSVTGHPWPALFWIAIPQVMDDRQRSRARAVA